MERVSTQYNFNKTTSEFLKTQASLAKLQQQISTGNKAETFGELGPDVSRTIDLVYNNSKAQSYLRENGQIINRLNSADLSIKQMGDIAVQLRNTILQKRSGSGDTVPLGSLATQLLQSVKDRLNTNIDGRYIFSGSKSDTQTFSNSITNNLINGEPSDNYYSGDNVDLQAQVSDGLTITYGIRGNEQAFKDIIGAINKAIEAEANGNDADLAAASDLTTQAIAGLATLRNKIGNNMKAIIDSNTLHTDSSIFYEKAKAELVATDIPSATIQVALNQTILQASFQVFAQISNLKLVNFL